MTHTEEYLRIIASTKVIGDFSPFDKDDIDEVEKYIKLIVERLTKIDSLIIEPDFSYYGSGFASYISIKVSKKDRSDTRITDNGNKKTEWKKGLLIYVSNLTPYWYYGNGEWTISYDGEKRIGGSGGFLRPESIDNIDFNLWQNEIQEIIDIFSNYKYELLTEEELSKPLWFEVEIPTILADKPYEIFDCFFYWED